MQKGSTLTIDERIQRMLDEYEIKNLLVRVHNCVDALQRGDASYEDYEANWTEDSVWESEIFGRFEGYEGHRRRHQRYPHARDPDAPVVESVHATVSTEVHLDGDEAICDSRWLYGVSQNGDGEVLRLGRYRDRVVRTPDGWRLQHRTVYA